MPTRRGQEKLHKLTQRERVSIRELDAKIRAARQRVAVIVHAAARERGIAVSGRNREALYNRIGQVYLQLDNGLKDWGKDLVNKAAVDWRDEAVKDIRGQTGIDPSNEVTRFSREYVEDVFKRVHPANGRSLAAVFTDKLTEEDVSRLRTAAIETFREASLSGMGGREIQRELQSKWDAAAGDMAAYRFVDAAGRPWSNARYLEMLVRTTEARVARDSYFDTLIRNGDDLVQVENVDGEACEICQAWDGVILSISGTNQAYPTYNEATNAGLFHPNCRCMAGRVDETVDAGEIEKQAEAPTPAFTRGEQETDGEYRRRMTEAVAEYAADFGGNLAG